MNTIAPVAMAAEKKQPLTVISPHLDDAVYSLGGLLAAGFFSTIHVVNVFSRTSWIFGESRTIDDGTITRKAEDRSAITAIPRADRTDLDLCDAVDRGISFQNVFTTLPGVIKADPIVSAVRAALARVVPKESYVLAPAGFGGHYDHLVVREASLSLADEYYADLPYAARDSKHSSDALHFVSFRRQWIVPSSDQMSNDHLALLSKYKSQVEERHLTEIEGYLPVRGYRAWT